VIPRNVQFIDGSAVLHVTLSSIAIENANESFVIEDGFLIDIVHQKLIRNVSDSSDISFHQIWKFSVHHVLNHVDHFHQSHLIVAHT
jgi:hypothetical protein